MRILAFFLFFLLPFKVYGATDVVTLKEGDLTAYFIEEHSLPVVTIGISFPKSGYAYDPAGKEGLASLATALMTEGAGKYSRKEFKHLLEESGAIIEISADADALGVYIKTLKENMESGISLALLALLEPRFDPEMQALIRDQMLLALAKERENVSDIAYRQWLSLAFKEHPYSRHKYGSETSLKTINGEDLTAYVHKHIRKNGVIFSMVGDLNETEAKAALKRFDETLPPSEEIPNLLPEWNNYPEDTQVFLKKEGAQQNAIYFGMPWVTYEDPDFYPAYLLNFILGGSSFDSRLGKNIREKRGLVYTVSSSIYAFDKNAFLLGYAAMRKGEENKVKDLIIDEIKDMHILGITEEELALAKRYLTGSFALMLDSSNKLINYLNFMQEKQLGTDFLEERNALIEKVTPADIERASKRLLSPKNLIIVTAGERQKQQKAGSP